MDLIYCTHALIRIRIGGNTLNYRARFGTGFGDYAEEPHLNNNHTSYSSQSGKITNTCRGRHNLGTLQQKHNIAISLRATNGARLKSSSADLVDTPTSSKKVS